MIEYAAEIVDGQVTGTQDNPGFGVIVGSPEWAFEHFGGEWVAVPDPSEAGVVEYAGPGFFHDETFPQKFAEPWVPPAPDPETGEWSWYPKDAVTGHVGRLWKSTTDRNVWVPGESGWHPEPDIEGVLPDWIQPTGSHDTWWLDAEVRHSDKDWRSNHPANVWEPGAPGITQWVQINVPETPDSPEWAEGTTYSTNQEVTYLGNLYRCNSNHTAWVGAGWNPAAVPSLWTLIGPV